MQKKYFHQKQFTNQLFFSKFYRLVCKISTTSVRLIIFDYWLTAINVVSGRSKFGAYCPFSSGYYTWSINMFTGQKFINFASVVFELLQYFHFSRYQFQVTYLEEPLQNSRESKNRWKLPIWIGYHRYFENFCYKGLEKPSGNLSLCLGVKIGLSHGLTRTDLLPMT